MEFIAFVLSTERHAISPPSWKIFMKVLEMKKEINFVGPNRFPVCMFA